MIDIKKRLDEDVNIVNCALDRIMSEEASCSSTSKVVEAENYSLRAGGKRIRPVLCLEFYRLFGGTDDISEIAACLELIHTFSLIHDDMPEMDNDELRRGKPTAHVQFGQATALLAGDGLAILPFKIISDSALRGKISYETAAQLIYLLSCGAGNEGMIAGQMMDIEGETTQLSPDQIIKLYRCKTGELIRCSCLFGAVLAGADKEQLKDAEVYADNIGVVFQLVDDILNISSTAEELGKPIGTDNERNKQTLISHLGKPAVELMIKESTAAAKAAVGKFEGSEFLSEFAQMLSERKN